MKTEDQKHNMNDGDKIVLIRTLRGVLPGVLASKLGVSRVALSVMEQREKIDDELLGKIAEILDVPLEFIQNMEWDTIDSATERKYPGSIWNIGKNSPYRRPLSQIYGLNNLSFDPLEKIIELYNRLLICQKEKSKLVDDFKNGLFG